MNGFDWILCESVWIWYEIGWLNFEYIGIFETLIFDEKKKMISPIWNENIWSMNCINIPYWVVSSFPFVDYFSSILSSGEEWWLGWGMVIIRIWLRILCWILFNFSYVHLDFLVFGSYLDIDPLNFMLVQSWVLEILKFVLVLELFKFANIWTMDFG